MYAAHPTLSMSHAPSHSSMRSRMPAPSAVAGATPPRPGSVRSPQEEADVPGSQRRAVHLDLPDLVEGQSVLTEVTDLVDDPLGTVARIPLRAERIGIAGVDGRVVRRDDPAGLRVELPRQVVVGDRADPLVEAVGPIHRPETRVGRRSAGRASTPGTGSRCGRRRRRTRSSARARRRTTGPPGSHRSPRWS